MWPTHRRCTPRHDRLVHEMVVKAKEVSIYRNVSVSDFWLLPE